MTRATRRAPGLGAVRSAAAALLLVALGGLGAGARAQPIGDLILSSSTLWSRPLGIGLEGSFAFVGLTEGMVLLDLTNPFEPQEVASLISPDSTFTGFTYEDSVAFLPMGSAGVALAFRAGFDSLALIRVIPAHFDSVLSATGRDGITYVLEPDYLFTYRNDDFGGVELLDTRNVPSGVTHVLFAGSALLLHGERGLYRFSLSADGKPSAADTLLGGLQIVGAAGSDSFLVAATRSGEIIGLRRGAAGAFTETARIAIPGEPNGLAMDSVYVATSSDRGFAIYKVDQDGALAPFDVRWNEESGGGALGFRNRTLCLCRKTDTFIDRIEIHSLLLPFEFTRIAGDTPGDDCVEMALGGGALYVSTLDSALFRYDAEPPPRIGERRLVAPIDSIQALAAGDSLVVVGRLNVSDRGAGVLVFGRAPDDSLLLRATFTTGGNPTGLEIADTLLAVAGGAGGVQLISLARSDAPVRLGGYDPPPNFTCQKVAFAGPTHLFAMNFVARSIHGLDVADPAAPSRVSLLTFSSLRDFAVDSGAGRMVVLDTLGVVTLFDISDPSAPVPLDTLATPGPPGNVIAIKNDVVLVGTRDSGFSRLLIVGGTGLAYSGRSDAHGDPSRIVFGSGAAYLLTPGSGVEVFAFSGANELSRRGEEQVSANVIVVATEDSLIAVGDALGTLQILRLTPERQLDALSATQFADRIRAAAFLSGDSLLAVVAGDTLLTLSVDRGGRVERLGSLGLDANANITTMSRFGTYLLIPSTGSKVNLVDFGNLAAPYIYSSFFPLDGSGISSAGNIRAVVPEGNNLFVVFRGTGSSASPRMVVAWDLTTPLSPAFVGAFNGGSAGEYLSAVSRGPFLYLAAGAEGIRVLSVVTPETMTELGYTSPVENTEGLTIVGDFLVAANGISGIAALDLGLSESAPQLVAGADTPGRSRDVAALPNTVVVADTYALLAYSTDIVIDDVTPPEFAIGLVLNPFVTSYADLYVIPSEPVVGVPQVQFVIADLDVFLDLEVLDPSTLLHHAALRLDRVGAGVITATGSDGRGNGGVTSKEIFLTLLRGADGGTVSIDDSSFAVSFPAGALPEEARVVALPESREDLRALSGLSPPAGAVPLGYRLAILPGDDAPATVSVRPPVGEAPARLQVYRLAPGGWTPLPSTVQNGRVVAESAGGGLFWLAEATGAPPASAVLLPNAPNPFNPSTMIRYEVPAPGGRVDLAVYSPDGRLVRRLAGGVESPGRKERVWDGTDDQGGSAASGVYLLRYEFEGHTASRKLNLLK